MLIISLCTQVMGFDKIWIYIFNKHKKKGKANKDRNQQGGEIVGIRLN